MEFPDSLKLKWKYYIHLLKDQKVFKMKRLLNWLETRSLSIQH